MRQKVSILPDNITPNVKENVFFSVVEPDPDRNTDPKSSGWMITFCVFIWLNCSWCNHLAWLGDNIDVIIRLNDNILLDV
jgi:hypothetical protein